MGNLEIANRHRLIEIASGTKYCMECDKKQSKGDIVFIHATSAWKNKINWRIMCMECQLYLIYLATGKKYLKKSVYDKMQMKFVAKEV
jgi:hypothetical protein